MLRSSRFATTDLPIATDAGTAPGSVGGVPSEGQKKGASGGAKTGKKKESETAGELMLRITKAAKEAFLKSLGAGKLRSVETRKAFEIPAAETNTRAVRMLLGGRRTEARPNAGGSTADHNAQAVRRLLGKS